MIDGETWEILARRLEQIRRLREEKEQPNNVELVFDSHDQATVVTRE